MYRGYIGGMSGSIGNGKENGNNHLGSWVDKSRGACCAMAISGHKVSQ